jgi:ParB family chromosome partitioning protein
MALGKGLGSIIEEKDEDSDSEKSSDNTKNNSPSKEKKNSSEFQNDEKSREEVAGQVIELEISQIVPNKEQPRQHFPDEELDELVESIERHGVLQPVTVTPAEADKYELIAGERRMRASKKAGLGTIPAIIQSATKQQKIELALIENIQRQDLNPIEEAQAYKKLMGEFELTQKKVANRVGKSRSAVANRLRLLDLPREIKQALKESKITRGKARALLSLDDRDAQIDMFKSMIGENISVRELEQEISSKKNSAGSNTSSSSSKTNKDPNLSSKEQELEDRLATKVNIKRNSKGKGKIEIDFYSNKELKRLIELLQ